VQFLKLAYVLVVLVVTPQLHLKWALHQARNKRILVGKERSIPLKKGTIDKNERKDEKKEQEKS